MTKPRHLLRPLFIALLFACSFATAALAQATQTEQTTPTDQAEQAEQAAVKLFMEALDLLEVSKQQSGEQAQQTQEKMGSLFTQAAELGLPHAMTVLSYFHTIGCCGVSEDPEKAFTWIKKAADLEEPIANKMLAGYYLRGIYTDVDLEKARTYYRNACDLDQENVCMTAMLLETGLAHLQAQQQAIPQDADEFFNITLTTLQQGAQAGDSQMQYKLARLYYIENDYLPQDFVKTTDWLKLSAAQNDPDALYLLGLFYSMGKGVEEDQTLALEHLNHACTLGDPQACVVADLMKKGIL